MTSVDITSDTKAKTMITYDSTTILDIDHGKNIKPHFCRETRSMEFDCYLDGQFVGTRDSKQAALELLDGLVLEQLRRAA
jgi:hypothetical protein